MEIRIHNTGVVNALTGYACIIVTICLLVKKKYGGNRSGLSVQGSLLTTKKIENVESIAA